MRARKNKNNIFKGKKAEEQTNRIMDNIKMDLVKMRLGV
jgi:hypothetical protein